MYVDFASGAGGPTPYIEKQVNAQLTRQGMKEVEFVLSDISPHIQAWKAASKKSENLHYIAASVDASAAPSKDKLLKDVPNVKGKGVMRLFSLAFHHFDDDLAKKILKNTIETSDGFWYAKINFNQICADFDSIFELQQRNYCSLLTVLCLWPMLMLMVPLHYLYDPTILFFTYLMPLVPGIVQFDGLISMLRTRTPAEVHKLLQSQVSEEELSQWRFLYGEEMHTWPFGWLSWIICYRDK